MSTVNLMPLSKREYKYWITKNCERQNCWIVVARLGEMLNHRDTVIEGPDGVIDHEDLPLTHDNMEYVYLVDFSDSRLIALVQDNEYYYLIDNTKISVQDEEGKDVEDYQSRIVYNKSLTGLVGKLSGGLRKKLKLKLSSKAKLRSRDVTQLEGVVSIDFIGKTHEEQVELFKTYAGDNKNKKQLDLSGLFVLDPKVIIDSQTVYPQEQIILYQNNKFNTFEWLKFFPNISILSVWYINTLTNDSMDELILSAPKINTLEFHYCYQLNGRILIPLSKLNLLDKLVINNEKCDLQPQTYETIIKDEEWAKMSNQSLSLVVINSHNLTLDFIDFFLKCFTNVTNFIMNELVLKKLEDNSSNGSKDHEDPISFHSVLNTNQGFKRYKNVKIYDLVRNKTGNTFSTSMLDVIKERCPDKAEAAELMKNELMT
jgi:hypothetical protein